MSQFQNCAFDCEFSFTVWFAFEFHNCRLSFEFITVAFKHLTASIKWLKYSLYDYCLKHVFSYFKFQNLLLCKITCSIQFAIWLNRGTPPTSYSQYQLLETCPDDFCTTGVHWTLVQHNSLSPTSPETHKSGFVVVFLSYWCVSRLCECPTPKRYPRTHPQCCTIAPESIAHHCHLVDGLDCFGFEANLSVRWHVQGNLLFGSFNTQENRKSF